MRNLVIIIALAIMPSLLSAQSKASTKHTSSANQQAISYEQRLKKVNPLVSYFNYSHQLFWNYIKSYTETIKPEQLITGAEKDFAGFYNSDNTFDRAIKDLTTSGQINIKEPELDKETKNLIIALEELKPLVKQSHVYYKEARQYELDNYAKGKELHPKLQVAFEKFSTASSSLYAAFEIQLDKLSEEELTLLEKREGRNLHYYIVSAFKNAEKHLKLVKKQELTSEEFNTSLAAYKEHFSKTDTFYRTNIGKMTAQQKEDWRLLQPRIDAIGYVSDAILENLKEVEAEKNKEEQALKANKPYKKSTSPSSPENQLNRNIDTLVRSFNDFVGGMNQRKL